MKNDFIATFASLDNLEKAAFRQYIYYFHATNKSVLKIFETVVKAIATHKSIDDVSASSYKDTHNALGDLKNWLIEFLTIQEVKSNSYEAKVLTLEALRKRSLKHLLAKKTKQIKEEIEAHPSPDLWSALLRLRLAHSEYFSTEIDKLKDYQPQLQYLLDELDNFYISTKLKYMAELESRRNILQETYNPRLMHEIVVLAQNDASIHPNIRHIYLPLLQLIKDKSVGAYSSLKKFLFQDKGHDKLEKLAILMYLLNFAALRLRTEPALYYQEYFELTQLGIKDSLFTIAGHFPTGTFSNIVNVGCHLKKYEWTLSFIKKWSAYLNADDAVITHNLALARVHFEMGAFETTIDLLNSIAAYKNVHFNLQIRILMARTYYELKRPLTVQINYCNALEKYVRTNDAIQINLKTNISNFLKILRALIYERPKKQILKTLENKGESVFNEWLLEKAYKLKK